MDNFPGRLGQYQIISHISSGGMTVVYKAYQSGLNRYVALKMPRPELANDSEIRWRFKQEAALLANLEHQHILPVFDYGEHEEYLYIVMPFVEGEWLKQRIRGKIISLPQIYKYISEIGSALDFVHEHGIVHRDVRPGSVLIDKKDKCLLCNFEVAKNIKLSSNEDGDYYDANKVIGNPAYMSPEQARGEEVDGRSDIYALGMVFYEMATGRLPYDTIRAIDILENKLYDPILLPCTVNPESPEEVQQVIRKALEKNPVDRYETAGKMATALKKVLFLLRKQERNNILNIIPTTDRKYLNVFICYSSSDRPKVKKIYAQLKKNEWIDPWLDEEKLLPGENWNSEIRRAVETASVVIVCLSHNSVNKEGYVQKEIKGALDAADEKPEGTIFIIPLKLEECSVPDRLSDWQWVNYFEQGAFDRLMRSLIKRAKSLGVNIE